MPFQPGQSGNPAGRPRGAGNKTTVLIEQLLEDDAESIIRKMIEQAKAGNPTALGLLTRALLPKRKGALIEIDLPLLEQASDSPGAIAAIIAAVCAGELTTAEGTSLTRMVEAFLRAKQKTGNLGRRPQREKVADVAAVVMRELEPHVSRDSQAPLRTPAMAPADAPPQAACVDLSVPAPWHAVFQGAASRSLLRQRRQVLSTTSPLAQNATNPAAIVSPLLSACASPVDTDRLPAAA